MKNLLYFLLIAILGLTIRIYGYQKEVDLFESTPNSVLREVIYRFHIDSLISDKEYFFSYDGVVGHVWMIVTRDSSGYQVLYPTSFPRSNEIATGREYEFDSVKFFSLNDGLFKWAFDTTHLKFQPEKRDSSITWVLFGKYMRSGMQVINKQGNIIYSYDYNTDYFPNPHTQEVFDSIIWKLIYIKTWLSSDNRGRKYMDYPGER